MTNKTMTATEVAQHIGITTRTLRNMRNDGRFPVRPIPGTWPRRWAVEAVEAWRLAGTDTAHAGTDTAHACGATE